MKEIFLSVLTGFGCGVVFAAFKLPVPAPPVFAGVAGILWAALIGALIPVAARAINPNDPAFGRLPKASDVEEALKSAKPRKKKSE